MHRGEQLSPGLIGAYPRTGVNDIGFGKIDYQVNAHQPRQPGLRPGRLPRTERFLRSGATYSNHSVTANGPIVLHERFLVGNWDSTPKSNMVNNLRFQWGMDNEITGTNSPGPNVNIASVEQYGESLALPRAAFPNERRWQEADTLSWTIGKHTVKFGVDVNQIHEVDCQPVPGKRQL